MELRDPLRLLTAQHIDRLMREPFRRHHHRHCQHRAVEGIDVLDGNASLLLQLFRQRQQLSQIRPQPLLVVPAQMPQVTVVVDERQLFRAQSPQDPVHPLHRHHCPAVTLPAILEERTDLDRRRPLELPALQLIPDRQLLRQMMQQ